MKARTWVLGAAVLVLLGAATAGTAFRRELLGTAAERYLAGHGLDRSLVAIEDLGLTRAALRLRLGADGPTIERITLHYLPFELLLGRIREITVSGLRMTVDLDSDQPLGPLENLLEGSGSVEGTVVPAPRVNLADAQLTIRGALPAPLIVSGEGAMDFARPVPQADLRLGVRDEAGKITTAARITASLDGDSVSVRLDDPMVVNLVQPPGGLPSRLRIEPDQTVPLVRFQTAPNGWRLLAAAGVADDTKVPLFGPAGLSLTLVKTGQALHVEGRSRWKNQAVPFQASYARGKVQGVVGPATLTFGDSLQLGDLVPGLGSVQVRGPIGILSQISWNPSGKLKANAQVHAQDVTLRTPEAGIEDLSGTVVFDSLEPLRTSPEQVVSAARVSLPVPLDDVGAKFRINGNTIEIAEASGKLAEGTIALHGQRFRLGSSAQALDLQVTKVSLGRLFEEMGVEGLSGEGRLSGELPVRFDDRGFAVENGHLDGEAGGIVRLVLGDARKTLEVQGEQMGLVVQALENFHYDLLQIRVTRPLGQALTLGIRMEGRNPDMLEGYPVNFNISLSGDPDPILAAIKEGRRLSGDLLRGAIQSNP